jgi:hypothetical protein
MNTAKLIAEDWACALDRENLPPIHVNEFSFVVDSGGYWVRWDSDSRPYLPFWLDIAPIADLPEGERDSVGEVEALLVAGSPDRDSVTDEPRRWLTRPLWNV